MSPGALDFDTFDAARTGSWATLEVLGRTHSRLVDYAPGFAVVTGDLAASSEQPDERTFLFRIDPSARWHGREPLNGRAVTAADVAESLARTVGVARKETLPVSQRAADWRTIESIDAPGPDLVRIRLKETDPFLLNTLAGAFAFIQAPELTADSSRLNELDATAVVGSGPFVFDGMFDGEARFVAHAAGHRVPKVARLSMTPPFAVAERFLAGVLHDVTVADAPSKEALLADPGAAASAAPSFTEYAVVSSMFVGAPPWNDVRLRLALVLALDRRELIRRIAPAGAAAGSVALHQEPFAFGLPESELSPGPRQNEARELWQAAGGPALGTVTIDFPTVFDPRYAASATVIELLSDALGPQFVAAAQSYPVIAEKLASRAYGAGTAAFWFGWGPRYTDPAPARHLIETYASTGPNAATTGYASETVDRLLGELMTGGQGGVEIGIEVLREIERDAGGGVITWFRPMQTSFRQPFVDGPRDRNWWPQSLDWMHSLDTNHSMYRE